NRRASAPSSVSWATPSPSKTPTTMVSAPVSGGACVGDRISMEGREAIVAAMPTTVILGAARTPVGRLGGGLSSLAGTELGGISIRAAPERVHAPAVRLPHVVIR